MIIQPELTVYPRISRINDSCHYELLLNSEEKQTACSTRPSITHYLIPRYLQLFTVTAEAAKMLNGSWS